MEHIHVFVTVADQEALSIFVYFDSDNDVSSTLEQCTGKLKLSEDKPDVEDTAGVLHFTMNCQNIETSASCVPHFAPLYISVFEAPDARGSSAQPTEHERTLLCEYQQREGFQVVDSMDSDEGVKGWSGEKYESAVVKHGDKAFHKFNKQLHVCPQQCLR